MYQHLINYLIMIRRKEDTAAQSLQRFINELKSRMGNFTISRKNCKTKEEKIGAANQDNYMRDWVADLEENRKAIERLMDKKF